MTTRIIATNIQWDLNQEDIEAGVTLPDAVQIPLHIDNDNDDAISDYLSDTTGFCHRGFATTTYTADDIIVNAMAWFKAHPEHEATADDLALMNTHQFRAVIDEVLATAACDELDKGQGIDQYADAYMAWTEYLAWPKHLRIYRSGERFI